MKIKNRIITIVIAIALTILTCIPIFAVEEPIEDIYNMIPADLGEIVPTDTEMNYGENYLNKAYLRINVNADIGTYFMYSTRLGQSIATIQIDITQDSIIISSRGNYSNEYGFVITNYRTLSKQGDYYYIPVFSINYLPWTLSTNQYVLRLYYSTETNYTTLINEYYNLGYNTGYESGFNEALENGIEHYTNITGYVTQLLTQFVGSESAQYITPIAIVLVILFVYFLFIRFLLSLIKAKGVIKTCDIVMVVACILLLVVMYAPMLNITINKNIRTDTIETTETTQIRRTEYIYDEYGRIISGPGGTVIYDEVESTTSEQEQTEVEVTTQPLEKEITTYEETKENIIRS